jgi:uncharacterized protein (TIGR03067 family)
MRPAALGLLAGLVVIAAGPAVGRQKTEPAPSGAAAAELEKLRGVWVFERSVVDGVPKDDGILKDSLAFDGSKAVWNNALGRRTGAVRVTPATTPKGIALDFKGPKGEPAGVAGVYEVSGDTLRIATAGPDRPLPKGFESKKGSDVTVWVLKRKVE